MSDELPEGWTSVALTSVLGSQFTGHWGVAPEKAEHAVHVVRNGDISRDSTVRESLPLRGLSSREYEKALLRSGDILVTTSGDLGKTALWPAGAREAAATNFVRVLRCGAGIEPGYLHYWIRTNRVQAAIDFAGRGNAIRNLPSSTWDEIEVLLAPSAEQRRIVAKVEALLEQVRRAKDRLERVPLILKRFRQAVLAAACSGQLTAQWREGHVTRETATELLVRLDSERKARWLQRNPKRRVQAPSDVVQEDLPSIPESWAWTNFDHCAWEITVGHVGPMKHRYVERGTPFLRSQNVRPLRFDPANIVFIDSDFHAALRKSQLMGGEILVTRSGANTGDCCVYAAASGEANCADLVITRPLSGLVPSYGAIYISSPEGQARIGLRETGMAQPHFNIKAMRVKAFPLPPFDEQQEIARRVEVLFTLAAAIEQRVERAALRAGNIPQAILSKAFAGELVLTEAELARAERRDYETAEQLLARVREAAHEQAPASLRRGRAVKA